MIEANWLAFIIVLLIGIAVAWWLFRQASTVRTPRERRPDALDEGAPPASRNQALIDAPPAAELTPQPGAGGMAGLGEIIAVGAQDEVEAKAVREAEKGASPPPAKAEPEMPPPGDGGPPDDLRRIKGIGPKLATLLNSLGITRYDQIAAWSDDDLDRIDGQLGSFAGRPRRDNWVEQAKFLAADDVAGYEAKYGKL
jgi:predicted flap endonuclease-1-like 5' DNA nuclease